MTFWDLDHGERAAIVDARAGATHTYSELRSRSSAVEELLARFRRRTLGLVLGENSVPSIVTYLAALRSHHPVVLMDASLARELFDSIIERYRPDWIFAPRPLDPPEGYGPADAPEGHLLTRRAIGSGEVALHPELALLLSTSGSTGSPKLVRLSFRNIDSNAGSIARYLELSSSERPISSLPMAYSYGLSIINSHLRVGAAVVLTSHGIVEREFWSTLRDHGCTSIAGVPYTYQMLLRLGLLRKELPSLRSLTQAGGRLDAVYVEQVHRIASERGWRFYVMYGQTEASPRISYVPPDQLARKIGSIGIAVPGGALTVDATGELVYSGPNVMLGYAESRAELGKGDELGGVLRTGDLGERDEDGFFYVTGRRKRFLKLFGQRFNLDDVERVVAAHVRVPVACLGSDDRLHVVVAGTADQVSRVREVITRVFSLHHSAVHVHAQSALPVNTNGKVDYKALSDVVTSP